MTLLVGAVLVLSGCTVNQSAEILKTYYSLGSISKSSDGGVTWVLGADAGDKGNTLLAANILSLEVSPLNSQVVYAGTEKNGLLVSRDGGETWDKTNFVPEKVYGLALSTENAETLYASGAWEGRGKIYKTIDGGNEWKEIYVEPSNGPLVTALQISRKNSQVLYAGTTEGMIIKTINGGVSWKNLHQASGPITTIALDYLDESVAYFVEFEGGILRAKNGGEDGNFEDLSKNIQLLGFGVNVYSLAIDPASKGAFYLGLGNGVVRGTAFGDKFEQLNVLESSKRFPVKSLAVNPQNSRELIYSTAGAIYRSVDRGEKWSVQQLSASSFVQQIRYNQSNPQVIYLGLRKN